MSTSAMLKAAAEIMNSTSMSAGKKAQELGALIKSEATFLQVNPNTKAAMLNVAKYGGIPIAAGVGAGIGVGAGAPIASAGIQSAFGLDFTNNPEESTQKVTSWIFFGIIIIIVLYFLLPQIKKVMK